MPSAASTGAYTPSTTTTRPHEPLLWAADAVCWAVGTGDDRQRRIATVLAVRDIRP